MTVNTGWFTFKTEKNIPANSKISFVFSVTLSTGGNANLLSLYMSTITHTIPELAGTKLMCTNVD
jgi:hypothetical protein